MTEGNDGVTFVSVYRIVRKRDFPKCSIDTVVILSVGVQGIVPLDASPGGRVMKGGDITGVNGLACSGAEW
jgi:hypothetical protein